MKSSHTGDQFAASGTLLENKALRIGETNKANEAQATKFARTDEERRAVHLAALQAKQRELEARAREQKETLPDESEPTTIDTEEETPCSH